MQYYITKYNTYMCINMCPYLYKWMGGGGEKKQIFTKFEFQITYVYTPGSET